MGFLDEIFESGVSGVSGTCYQIVSTHSQSNENEYVLSTDTRHSRPKCHSELSRIQRIASSRTPDELVQSMVDYVPGQLSDSELRDLTRAYESKMAEFLPAVWTEEPAGQPDLPEASEPGLKTQNPGHIQRCGDCRHFERDSINPREGLGDCSAFLLPDGKRQIARYPMEHPKTETCFGKEVNREVGV